MQGAPALYANIPIVSVKEEAKESARKVKSEEVSIESKETNKNDEEQIEIEEDETNEAIEKAEEIVEEIKAEEDLTSNKE